jgi:hypothetical protein
MSNNKNISNAASARKRRWLNIGPGIVIALAVSALIGSQYIETETNMRQQHSAPPIVERQVISSSADERSGPTPDAAFIIKRADKLHLSQDQVARLNVVESKWQAFYAPKIAQANQAAAQTNHYLSDAKDRSRTPVAQIRNAAAPVIALSGEISAARRSYWDQATKILTPDQGKALQAEREADWAARMKPLSHSKAAGG